MNNDVWPEFQKDYTHLYVYKKMQEKDAAESRILKIALVACLLILAVALVVMIYAINLPRTVPMVITVSDWGEAKYVGEVSKLNYAGIKVPAIAIEYQLRKFVSNKFTLSTDPNVVRKNLKDCYSCLTNSSSQKLSEELRAYNPLRDVGKIVRNVEIQSVLNVTQNSYQVDFIVTTSSISGRVEKVARYRGLLTTALMEPSDDDKILNPLGIYIKNFDFTEIKTGINK